MNITYQTTPKQLFETVLPTFLASTPVDLAGAVRFDVAGTGGGSWLVDFAKREIKDGSGNQTAPVAIVQAGDIDFMALVAGRMSPEDGIITGRLKLAGDAVAIAKLMTTLSAIGKA